MWRERLTYSWSPHCSCRAKLVSVLPVGAQARTHVEGVNARKPRQPRDNSLQICQQSDYTESLQTPVGAGGEAAGCFVFPSCLLPAGFCSGSRTNVSDIFPACELESSWRLNMDLEGVGWNCPADLRSDAAARRLLLISRKRFQISRTRFRDQNRSNFLFFIFSCMCWLTRSSSSMNLTCCQESLKELLCYYQSINSWPLYLVLLPLSGRRWNCSSCS